MDLIQLVKQLANGLAVLLGHKSRLLLTKPSGDFMAIIYGRGKRRGCKDGHLHEKQSKLAQVTRLFFLFFTSYS